jgi:class 3 adenylate cyclase
MAFPREAVWPVLSQTDWINRSAGLPPVTYAVKPTEGGGSFVTGAARLWGREIRWLENPFEWLEPEFYRVHRVFENGFFKEARMGMDLASSPDGGTSVDVYAEVIPRNALGRLIASRILGPKTGRDMRRIISGVEDFLRGRAVAAMPRLAAQTPNEGALAAGLRKLGTYGAPAELSNRLEDFLRRSPDVELAHIRPFAVARIWAAGPWDVLRLFLNATRSGLLDFSWEILCPNCRSSRELGAVSLSQLRKGSHCDVCAIKFDAEFDKSVELKFAVNPSIRSPERQTFCLIGPGGKPHVASQICLSPRETRICKWPHSERPWRLRSAQVAESRTIGPAEISGEGAGIGIVCESEGFVVHRDSAGVPRGYARWTNPRPIPVLVCVERAGWSEDILTAARVTNWQEFRDLFSNEVISPSEQVTVGSQVVLFTDLCGSTAMYHGLGDAPAYVVVRDHFAVLMEAVRDHHGAVVKTIGDAVMATFSRVDEALAAARQMHRKLAVANPATGESLALKSSLHVGPCLAVNANDKLDFFGTTINLAARMVDCCRGRDLTVSDELFQRPEMTEFLAGIARPPEASEVRFRGFDEPRRVWRLEMDWRDGGNLRPPGLG